jgi:hypothetical protein
MVARDLSSLGSSFDSSVRGAHVVDVPSEPVRSLVFRTRTEDLGAIAFTAHLDAGGSVTWEDGFRSPADNVFGIGVSDGLESDRLGRRVLPDEGALFFDVVVEELARSTAWFVEDKRATD